jgi:hypothetical protein
MSIIRSVALSSPQSLSASQGDLAASDGLFCGIILRR